MVRAPGRLLHYVIHQVDTVDAACFITICSLCTIFYLKCFILRNVALCKFIMSVLSFSLFFFLSFIEHIIYICQPSFSEEHFDCMSIEVNTTVKLLKHMSNGL